MVQVHLCVMIGSFEYTHCPDYGTRSCPSVSALSAVLFITILCGNNEPKRSCRYFAAFRVRIGCAFRMAFLVCSSLFCDRLWRRDEELWRYARARVGQGEEESDGCAEAHSARAITGLSAHCRTVARVPVSAVSTRCIAPSLCYRQGTGYATVRVPLSRRRVRVSQRASRSVPGY